MILPPFLGRLLGVFQKPLPCITQYPWGKVRYITDFYPIGNLEPHLNPLKNNVNMRRRVVIWIHLDQGTRDFAYPRHLYSAILALR